MEQSTDNLVHIQFGAIYCFFPFLICQPLGAEVPFTAEEVEAPRGDIT